MAVLRRRQPFLYLYRSVNSRRLRLSVNLFVTGESDLAEGSPPPASLPTARHRTGRSGARFHALGLFPPESCSRQAEAVCLDSQRVRPRPPPRENAACRVTRNQTG